MWKKRAKNVNSDDEINSFNFDTSAEVCTRCAMKGKLISVQSFWTKFQTRTKINGTAFD